MVLVGATPTPFWVGLSAAYTSTQGRFLGRIMEQQEVDMRAYIVSRLAGFTEAKAHTDKEEAEKMALERILIRRKNISWFFFLYLFKHIHRIGKNSFIKAAGRRNRQLVVVNILDKFFCAFIFFHFFAHYSISCAVYSTHNGNGSWRY